MEIGLFGSKNGARAEAARDLARNIVANLGEATAKRGLADMR
jgi:hypothetical protein